MARRIWNPSLHPRDRLGRFANKLGGSANNKYGYQPGYRKRIAKNALKAAGVGAALGAMGGAGYGQSRAHKKMGIYDKNGWAFTVPAKKKGWMKVASNKDRAKYTAANAAFYGAVGAASGAAAMGKFGIEGGHELERRRAKAAKKKGKGSRRSKYPVSTV